MRIAHVADVHVGSRVPEFGGIARAFPDSGLSFDALERVTSSIEAGAYDLVVVAGDVFDRHAAPEVKSTVVRFAERMEALSLPVVMIGGNHDVDAGMLFETSLPASTRLFAADSPESAVFDDLGVAVHGQSVGYSDEIRRLASGYPAAIPGFVNIGVLHTSWHAELSKRVCAPANLDDLRPRGYDYWALGHVHEFLSVSETPLATYAGTTHGRTWAERGPHGYADVRIDENGVTASLRETAPVQFETSWATDVDEVISVVRESRSHVVWRAPALSDEQLLAVQEELPGRLVVSGANEE